VQALELRILSKPHEPEQVLFDQEIGQLSSDDVDSVLQSHYRFGMSIVPVSLARQRTCSTFQIPRESASTDSDPLLETDCQSLK
jgi:hypothetical protein